MYRLCSSCKPRVARNHSCAHSRRKSQIGEQPFFTGASTKARVFFHCLFKRRLLVTPNHNSGAGSSVRAHRIRVKVSSLRVSGLVGSITLICCVLIMCGHHDGTCRLGWPPRHAPAPRANYCRARAGAVQGRPRCRRVTDPPFRC